MKRIILILLFLFFISNPVLGELETNLIYNSSFTNIKVISDIDSTNLKTLNKNEYQEFSTKVFFEQFGEYVKTILVFYLTVLSILIALNIWAYNRVIDMNIPEDLAKEYISNSTFKYLILNFVFLLLLFIGLYFLLMIIGIHNTIRDKLSMFLGINYIFCLVLIYFKKSVQDYNPNGIIDKVIDEESENCKKVDEESEKVLVMIKNFFKYDEKELFSYIISRIFETKNDNFVSKYVGSISKVLFESSRDKRMWYMEEFLKTSSEYYKDCSDSTRMNIKDFVSKYLEEIFIYVLDNKDFSYLNSIIYRLSDKEKVDNKIIEVLIFKLLRFNKEFIKSDENFDYVRRFNEFTLVFCDINVLKNEKNQDYFISLLIDFIFNLYLIRENYYIWEYIESEHDMTIFRNIIENSFENLDKERFKKFTKKFIYSIFLLGGIIIKHYCRNKLVKKENSNEKEYTIRILNSIANNVSLIIDFLIENEIIEFNNVYSFIFEIVDSYDFEDFKEFLDNHFGKYFIINLENRIFAKAYTEFQELIDNIVWKFVLYFIAKNALYVNKIEKIPENFSELFNNLKKCNLLKEEEIEKINNYFGIEE